MVTEDDLTLGGGHKMKCEDHVSQMRVLETMYFINYGYPNKFYKKRKKDFSPTPINFLKFKHLFTKNYFVSDEKYISSLMKNIIK